MLCHGLCVRRAPERAARQGWCRGDGSLAPPLAAGARAPTPSMDTALLCRRGDPARRGDPPSPPNSIQFHFFNSCLIHNLIRFDPSSYRLIFFNLFNAKVMSFQIAFKKI